MAKERHGNRRCLIETQATVLYTAQTRFPRSPKKRAKEEKKEDKVHEKKAEEKLEDK